MHNPTLGDKVLEKIPLSTNAQNRMTIEGSVNKTLILLALVIGAAAFSWNHTFRAISGEVGMGAFIAGGAIGGLIFALITIFKKEWSGVTAPLYAVCEGFFLGAISALFENEFQGIVFQAIGLTFGVLLVMLFLYRSRIIKVTEKLRMGVIMATGAVALVYLLSFVLSFFSIRMPFIHEGGIIGVGISLVIVGIAAFNLLLDFDFIEKGSARGLPKYMEWYGGFGLMVTLIWLYLEILRLLAKLRDN